MTSKRKVAPRKPFQLRDRYVYVLLVAVSVLARLPFLKTYDMVSYDGTYYVNHAWTILGAMDRPSGFPIGYPMFIALFIPIIRDGVRAAQTVSFLAGLGSLFVFYALAKRFVRGSHALAGALILALTPLFISLSMMTMSESIYVLWLLLGLFCYSKEKYLLSGLFMGLAAITRPEALGVLGVLALLMLRRPKRLLWIIAGFACVYCINVAIQSGTAGKLVLVSKTSLFGTSASNWRLREAWVDFPEKEKALEAIARKSASTTVLVDYLKRMPREVALLILHVSPVIFLLSLYGIYRRRLFLLAALVPFFAFPLFTFRSEPRFILPYVPLFILYSFIGLEELRERVVYRPMYRPLYAFLIVSVSSFFFINRGQLITPVSNGDQAAKHEGLRFRGIVGPEDRIADRKPFFAFYAGGRYVEIPFGPLDETVEHLAANHVKYIFLDRGLIDVARPYLKPLLYDRAAIAGEMRFSQRSFNPGGIVIYERAMESEPLRQRYLMPPVEGTISGISWSPDGKKIAYRLIETSGGGGIYVISPDGGEPRLLVPDRVTENQIAWSPDSKRIAFAMIRSNNINIFISNESGDLTRITSNPGGDSSPSWSNDGREMIFCSRVSGQFDIWSKNIYTGALTRITENGGNISPAISPDGKKIAWVRDGEGVCVYERSTGAITHCESPKKVYFVPAWSPDGNVIAVMAKDWGQTDIYLMTADGRNTLLLTKSIMMGTPAWSPDGQALAVATREDDKMGIAILTGIQPYKDRLMNPKPIRVFQGTQ